MTDKTINTLDTELTTVGANDLIGVWDVAAAQYKKAKRSNVVGATITGGGTIALGGYTLTVPATGTLALRGSNNAFSVAQTMAAGIQVGVAANALTRPQAGVVRQQLETVSLANNATLTIAAVSARGFFFAFNASNGNVAVGVSNGTAVTLLHNSGNFSATQDNANTLNIYPSGANLILQNKMADARNVSFWLIL